MERPRHPVNDPRAAAARPVRRGLACVAVLVALGGCSWLPTLPALPGADIFDSPRQLRGQQVDDEELRQITVGVSTRNDVTAILGSPTATATFDDDNWYYIGGVTRQRPGRALAIEEQQVVVVSFDGRGVVREIRRVGRDEGREVAIVQRETASPGNERTLLQQLFGNIGRVGPGLGAQQPTAPGPTPSGR